MNHLSKKLFREKMLLNLKQLSKKKVFENSVSCLDWLWENLSILGKGPVCCYISFGFEMPTSNLIVSLLNNGFKVQMPVTKNKKIFLAGLDSVQDFNRIVFNGFPNMDCFEESNERPSAFIVPGIAFTLKGDRIGRGKGFYDKLLTGYKESVFVGYCHSIQVTKNIPTEKHDIKMHYLCTEKGFFKCKKSN